MWHTMVTFPSLNNFLCSLELRIALVFHYGPSAILRSQHLLFNPLHSGFCPNQFSETPVIKVINDLHVPTSSGHAYVLIFHNPLAAFHMAEPLSFSKIHFIWLH